MFLDLEARNFMQMPQFLILDNELKLAGQAPILHGIIAKDVYL